MFSHLWLHSLAIVTLRVTRVCGLSSAQILMATRHEHHDSISKGTPTKSRRLIETRFEHLREADIYRRRRTPTSPKHRSTLCSPLQPRKAPRHHLRLDRLHLCSPHELGSLSAVLRFSNPPHLEYLCFAGLAPWLERHLEWIRLDDEERV